MSQPRARTHISNNAAPIPAEEAVKGGSYVIIMIGLAKNTANEAVFQEAKDPLLQNIALLEAKSAAIENSIKEENREQIIDLKKNRELVKVSLDKAGSTKNNWYAGFAQEYATTFAEIETFSTEKEKLKTAIRNYSQEKTKVLSDLKEAKNRGQTPENELNALHALAEKRKELELKLEDAKRTENKLNTQLKTLHEQIKTTLPALETTLPQRPEVS